MRRARAGGKKVEIDMEPPGVITRPPASFMAFRPLVASRAAGRPTEGKQHARANMIHLGAGLPSAAPAAAAASARVDSHFSGRLGDQRAGRLGDGLLGCSARHQIKSLSFPPLGGIRLLGKWDKNLIYPSRASYVRAARCVAAAK